MGEQTGEEFSEEINNLLKQIASDKRRDVLRWIEQGPCRLTSIANGLNFGVQDTHRNVQNLIDAHLVRKSDGILSLTTYGKMIIAQLPTFDFLVKNMQYMNEHSLCDLPEKFVRRIGDLAEGELVEGVVKVLTIWREIYSSATEYIHAAKSQVSLEMIGAASESVRAGARYSYILGESSIAPKGRGELLNRLGWKEMMAEGNIQRRMAKNVSVVVILNEKWAALSLPDLRGKADLNWTLHSRDPEFHDWCRDYFMYKWERAEFFDESKLKKRSK
jgi:predicted transcriptional regulator